MSTLTVYPTRRQALKAAHASAGSAIIPLIIKQRHKRPPFQVFGQAGEDDRWFTSRTEFKQNEQLHRDTHSTVVEIDE
jgi:hypothetical protein